MSERRLLAPVERMVDVFDRGSTLNFTIIARVRGALSAHRLEDALRRLEVRHPLLRARLERDPKGAAFVMGEAKPIPLTEEDGPLEAWREIAEATLAHRVWADEGPRAELTWLRHSDDSSTLILLQHHLVSDGSSGMFAMRDLIRLAADPTLVLEPIPAPAPSSFYPKGHGSWRWKLRMFAMLLKSTRGAKPQRLRVAGQARAARRTRLARLHIPREESLRLMERGRRDGATVHGVVCAALARAIAAQLGPTPAFERILHPVDLRRYARQRYPGLATPGEAVGYYVSSVDTDHRVDLACPLGALAQEITLAVRTGKEREQPFVSAPLAGPMLTKRNEQQLGDLVKFRDFAENKVLLTTFSLTNLGPLEKLGIEPDCGSLEIEDLFFVAAGSVVSTLGGAVTMFQGSLTITVGWVEPIVSEQMGERVVALLEHELANYIDGSLTSGSAAFAPANERGAPVEVSEFLRD